MTKILRALAAAFLLLAIAGPKVALAAPVTWSPPMPALLAAPASVHAAPSGILQLASAFNIRRHKGGGGGGGWDHVNIDCNGVPYPLGVKAAGVQDAWDAVCTAGPRVTSWNAAPATGGTFTNGGVDIEMNGGTVTLAAPDLGGHRLWVFGGADLTLNDAKMNCGGNADCNANARLLSLAYDSGQNPRTAATIRINYGDFDSSGRTNVQNQETLVLDTSILYSSHTRWHKGAMDYIQTSDTAKIYSDHSLYAAFCLAGFPGTPPTFADHDHCEAVHVYGTLESHYDRFDSSVDGPTTCCYSAEVYLDGHVASGVQTDILDHCVVNLVPSNGNYPINLAGTGTLTLHIGNCALRKGTSGYLTIGAQAAVEDGPNYDLVTGARLICGGSDPAYPVSCFILLIPAFRRRRAANDNEPARRRIAA